MNFNVGQRLWWVPTRRNEPIAVVTVTDLRRRGARLSNGWTVDEDGYAEGTDRHPGGHVVDRPAHEEGGTTS